MTPIQLLVLDIDGTIAGKSNQVEAPVQQAIQAAQAQGIQVAIATGRMYRSALRFHQAVGSQLPLMAYQGALIKDPLTNTTYRHTPLSRDLTFALLQALVPLEAQSLSIHLYIDDELHVRSVIPETATYAARSGVTPRAVGDLVTFLQANPTLVPTKLLALCDDPGVIGGLLTQIRQQHRSDELYITTSVANFFEATHPSVNKGTAVRFLAEELLNLHPDQVMVIGDNFNDLEMIQYAGIGVAMGDAPAGVKQAADWIAPDVEAHGAAIAIQQFLL